MPESSRLISTALGLLDRADRDPRIVAAAEVIVTAEPPAPIYPDRVGLISLSRGSEVLFQGERVIVEYAFDSDSVAVRDPRTGRHAQAPVSHLLPVPVAGENDAPRPTDPAIVPEVDWQEAVRRLELIRPLLTASAHDGALVEDIATSAGVSVGTIYRWRHAYQESGLLARLLPHHPDGGRGENRLEPNVHAVLENVITTFYLQKQRPTGAATVTEVSRQCVELGLKPPHPNTVRNRLKRIPPRVVMKARHGADAVDDAFGATPGTFPHANFPLAVVQIDHSPADVILVDDETRLPIGRALLTLAIDVFTRMVLGFFVSLEAPSTLAVGMCLVHAILPKDRWMRERGFTFRWPCFGFPRIVHADNAKEFRGMMLARAAQQFGFSIEWRPVTKARYGGHIESLMGTSAEEMRILPGATFSNPLDRGTYDSAKNSAMTVREYEEWLTRWITGVYHNRTHSALGMSPARKWEESVLGSAGTLPVGLPRRVTDDESFTLNFLPLVTQSVQKYGVLIDGVKYWEDVLRPYIKLPDPDEPAHSRKFTFRRDPRDISAIFFLDPERQIYWRIPWSDRTRSPVSLWEWREARRAVKERGGNPEDEREVYAQLTKLREREAASVATTQSVRRREQRRRESARHAVPQRQATPAPKPAREPANTEPAPLAPFDDIDPFPSGTKEHS